MIINNKEIEMIIFDLDGTLLDSGAVWKDVDKKFFEKRKIEMPLDYGQTIAHMGFDNASHYTKVTFNLKESEQEIINEWESSVIDAYVNEIELKPYAREFLKLAKEKKCILNVATANQKNCYEPCLRRNQVIDFFKKIIDVKNYKNGKKTPDIYLDIAKSFQIDPSKILVIEDISTALKSAREGGFVTCAIYEKTSKEENEKKDIANIYINSFLDLINMVK